MLPLLAGASLIYGAGMLENGMVMNAGQLYADADAISMLRFAQRGLPINDETLALDVIREVGIQGEYLSTMHTFQNFKTEQSNPTFMNRDNRADWLAKGGQSMHGVCMKKAVEFLATEPKEIISSEIQEKVNAVISKAEAEWE